MYIKKNHQKKKAKIMHSLALFFKNLIQHTVEHISIETKTKNRIYWNFISFFFSVSDSHSLISNEWMNENRWVSGIKERSKLFQINTPLFLVPFVSIISISIISLPTLERTHRLTSFYINAGNAHRSHTHIHTSELNSFNWIPMIILYSCRTPKFSCSVLCYVFSSFSIHSGTLICYRFLCVLCWFHFFFLLLFLDFVPL